MDKIILQKWLKSGYMDKHVFYETEAGTPQGGIISPVLANVTLDGLERCLREKYPARTATSRKAQVNLIRYADDFVITGRTRERLEEEVRPLVETFLRERGLELSAEKTTLTHIEDGFDFLGQTVRKYRGKLLIQPSKKNVKTFLANIRKVIKANRQATAFGLIAQLNPKIRGWANYHRHAASKRTFVRVDDALFRCLWQWAKRRHPNKRRRGIADKYFGSTEGRHWRFFGEAADEKGRLRRNWITLASSTPIRRHAKIKGAVNPYDPEWEVYLETRLGIQMGSSLKGRRKLSYLWRQQGGVCPVCQEKITHLTGWHNHHIVYRVNGGAETSENRVLLHPNCHSQVHAKGLSVMKPRPSRGVCQA
jgi:RNA-directed DNA polymerase